jgi:ATP-dependent DNA helicase RecQ
VPAYTVLHDSSLREIAQQLPDTLLQLQGVTGVGAAKLERYGDEIIAVVRASVP